MPTFPKVKSGDLVQLSEAFLNRLISLANAPDGRLQGGLFGGDQLNTILIQNTTAAYVESSGILGIGNSIIEPDEDELAFRFTQPTFEGVEPVKGVHEYKFCVLHQGLEQNEFGLATAFGSAMLQVDFIDGEHEYATIAELNSTAALESSPVGPARIIWASNTESDGTGLTWAHVQFPAHEAPLLWKATADAESDDTILASRVDSNGDIESTAPEFTFKVIP